MSQRERAVYVSPGDGDFCPQRPARADPARADRKDPHARGRDSSAVQHCAQRQMLGASDLCRHCAARHAGLNLNCNAPLPAHEARDRKSRKSRDMISSLARLKISFESPSTAARRPPAAARRPDLAATKPGRGGRRAQVRRTGAPLAHGPLRRGAAGGAREGCAELRALGFRRTPPRLTASADPSLPVRLPLGPGLRTRHGGVCRGRPRLPAIARTSSSPGILLSRFAISRNHAAIPCGLWTGGRRRPRHRQVACRDRPALRAGGRSAHETRSGQRASVSRSGAAAVRHPTTVAGSKRADGDRKWPGARLELNFIAVQFADDLPGPHGQARWPHPVVPRSSSSTDSEPGTPTASLRSPRQLPSAAPRWRRRPPPP